MNKRRKVCRRVPVGVKVPLSVPKQAGQTWRVDFTCNILVNRRQFRTLNITPGDSNRAVIAIEVTHIMPATKVTQILERSIHEQGKLSCIQVDNGPKFTSGEFKDRCLNNGIDVQYTQPGKPMQNGYIERFNRTFRENILDAYLSPRRSVGTALD